MGSYIIQSVQLRREKFTRAEAFKWVRDHGYKADKVDITPHFYRFRQHSPDPLHGGRFRQIHLGEVGEMTAVYF